MRKICLGLLGLASLGLTAGASAAPAPPGWGQALPERVLAQQRGGFIDENGLKITVGLESLVRVNGELRSQLQVQLPDLAQLAKAGTTLNGQMAVVQNGTGNSLPADLGSQVSGLSTFIQNSLDDQVIQNLKSLNIEISGLQGLSRSQIKQRVNGQLVESLR
jgi:hypothetical protein